MNFMKKSDGPHFHQYQQNEQSLLTLIEPLNTKRPGHVKLKIQVVSLEQAHKCSGVKSVNGIQNLPNGNTYTLYKQTIIVGYEYQSHN